ncbi:MAG: hypothetical protein GFH27_549423n44 [Chloroflexi bacterium AL-W]|nr:hypothetical protein [Blastochloris sp.]NOK64303.1 hypothetical protein [Chloroflexi bacterium AL-N1]NOK71548.1 hypothetical protein [Chloroflexi bacterium AL-N10]NOK78894.1 hypothetical protein [Chloroflexi bacterium AL-N5]NOK86370.1 hypothetical protein [Chloroflexi bacterium AL-W]NOK93339.1 hypothetical protein [Chloroflexi bacterium AL-N15]
MRIIPNFSRLRAVALVCWILSTWYFVNGDFFVINHPEFIVLTISTRLLALFLLAIGLAFWQLGTDRRAGIVFDSKGLLLNLGSSSAFIAWENIELVGISYRRNSVLSIGSRRQLGVVLREVQPYIQSYEERLPASRGIIAYSLRRIDRFIRRFRKTNDVSLATQIANNLQRTGYHVLIPEVFLGSPASAFAEIVDIYRLRPANQRTITNFILAK